MKRTRASGQIWRAADRAAWRAERRRAARRHHPDVGGDLREYLRVTADIDARYGLDPKAATYGSAPETRGRTSARNDRRSRARRRLAASVGRTRIVSNAIRSRLPRWVPGARRYTRIGPWPADP